MKKHLPADQPRNFTPPQTSTMDLVLDARCWWTRRKAKALLEERFLRTFTQNEVISYILEDPRKGARLLNEVATRWYELPDPEGSERPQGNRYTVAAEPVWPAGFLK